MFNEKAKEYTKEGELPVWQSPKYIAAREAAVEIIKSGKYGLTEADFWILMNLTAKKDKMAYSGLIISHNGCLKINDKLESKFVPSCVVEDKEGYRSSLVYKYCNDEQGIFEVGEVNPNNCRNDYPHAMAFKRLYDRVVLKLSKLAYAGIYSDSESDEFAQQITASEKGPEANVYDTTENQRGKLLAEIRKLCKDDALVDEACKRKFGKSIAQLDNDELEAVRMLMADKKAKSA